MISEYEAVKKILDQNDITDADQIEYGSEVFEELMDYYMNSGDMPYGVMKARTGMPDEWIIDRIFELDLLKDSDEKAGLESHYFLKDMI
jgi:hypothetical protein